MPFKVATYNVLASAYIKPAWYEGVPEHLLQAESRVPALVHHIEELNADILCLQEVEVDVFAALKNRLVSQGYEGHYEQKGHGRPDGCSTFIRKGMFTVQSSQRLEYHDQESGPEEISGHVALLLALKHDEHVIGVANTHIRWSKPGTLRDEQVGYRQVMELIATCKQFEPACRDWIACGDFNYKPDSDVVRAMRDAGYAFAHADRPHIRTAVANGRAKLIDYVFHTAGLRAKPLDPAVITDASKLPSPDQPSDHLVLMAEFDWVDHP